MDFLHLFHNDHGEWSAVTAFLTGLPVWRAYLATALAWLSTNDRNNHRHEAGRSDNAL